MISPKDPSLFSDVVFVAIVLGVAVLASRMLFRVAPAGPGRGRWLVQSHAIGVLVWLAIPGALAWAGALDRYNPLPAPALVVVAVVTVATLIVALSGFGDRVARTTPIAALVGFQVFRVPVEWWLHRLFEEGVVPVQMTYAGRNFDIVTGLTAAALALLIRSGRATRGLVMAWNILGMGLLINIVAIAVLSTPVPFRHFTHEPANVLPSMFPQLWLPTFLVQAALFGHIMVSRALRLRPAGG